jgi:nucleoside-diphosphate-sugar epimerase
LITRTFFMRVFVTGATGFIGFAIVNELLSAGHQVTGLARSAASGKKLTDAGARVVVGSIEDSDCLRRAAAAADGAIHTAFYHKLSHIGLGKRLGLFLGGAPGGIVQRFMTAAVDTDRRALETIGRSLAGTDRPLVAAFATMAMKEGQLASEDQPFDPDFFAAPRAETEHLLQRLAADGVRTSAIRLPPSVHGKGDQGFVPMLIDMARKKNASRYVGDGSNRWPSVHRLDAARLFRLALESGKKGGTYHGVAEEGIAFRQIAELIGQRLNLPAVGTSPAQAKKSFGFLSEFVAKDNPTSSALTQARLGWHPTQPGLLADLAQADYLKR